MIQELKNELIEKVKPHNPCASEFGKLLNAESEEDILQLIKDNFGWCSEHHVISDGYLSKFKAEILLKYGIANTGEGNTGMANTGDRNTGDRNTGDWNTGDRNTGYRNTGDWNTGDWNTGDRNTGYSNTGDRNTGYRNTGDRNTGDRNTGYRNTGDWNTGYSNTGDWNTGDWNTGDRNTGYSNTGDRNTGAFCTGETTIKLFNKESNMTHQDFINSRAYNLLCEVDTKMWVYENSMTDAEKEKYPSFKTSGGYLKDIPFKEAFGAKWHNWSDESKAAFTSLPNFDSEIFFEITGVKI